MTFWDHVDELRSRLLRSVGYVTVGTLVGWFVRNQILEILRWPADVAAQQAHIENFAFRIFEPAGGLVLALQMSFVAGIVLASPLLVIEMWGFFEPALHKNERRWAAPFIVLAVFFFLSGIVFCYVLAPQCFRYFFNFNKDMGVQPELTLAPYLYFLMRFLLAVGLAFELPLVLMIAAVAGFVNSAGMVRYWRQATVGVFVVAAIITPTTDPVTCTLVGIPMAGLYLVSILLVRLVEKVVKRRAAEDEAETLGEAPADDTYQITDESDTHPESEGISDPPPPV
jgi:sec-independent protein translocase protein TatC